MRDVRAEALSHGPDRFTGTGFDIFAVELENNGSWRLLIHFIHLSLFGGDRLLVRE
jgi:hypothetical protein